MTNMNIIILLFIISSVISIKPKICMNSVNVLYTKSKIIMN